MKLDAYRQALTTNPLAWKVSYNLGLAHMYTGQVCHFQKQRPPFLLSFSTYIRACPCCGLRLGLQFATAHQHFTASVCFHPDYALSHMCLAICLARLEEPDKALESYERASALSK